MEIQTFLQMALLKYKLFIQNAMFKLLNQNHKI